MVFGIKILSILMDHFLVQSKALKLALLEIDVLFSVDLLGLCSTNYVVLILRRSTGHCLIQTIHYLVRVVDQHHQEDQPIHYVPIGTV